MDFGLSDVLNIGKTALGVYQGYKQNSNDNRAYGQITDYYRQRAEKEYDNLVANAEAQNQYNQAMSGYRARAAAAANAAARARASAAQQEMKNQMAAKKKGMKEQQKYYDTALSYLTPYRQAGEAVLPDVTNTYKNSLGGMNLLYQYLTAPGALAKLNQGRAAHTVSIPIPDYLKG